MQNKFSPTKKEDEQKYFDYISSLIKSKDLNSMIPYYLCEEDGHQTNQLDIVCLDPECKHQGLICFRCQYHRHQSHVNQCVPLHVFMANLIMNQNDLSRSLAKKREKCYYLREFMIDSVKTAIEKIIDQFSLFVGSLHRYYQSNDRKIEDITVKSDVVLHRLFFKKHINHLQFNDYIRDVVKKVESINRNKVEEIEIVDYKAAINLTEKYLQEMGDWANELSNNVEKLYFQAKKDIRLNIISSEDLKNIENSSIHEELKGFSQKMLNQVKSSFKSDFPKPNLLLFGSADEDKIKKEIKPEKTINFSKEDENLTTKNDSQLKYWRQNYLNFH